MAPSKFHSSIEITENLHLDRLGPPFSKSEKKRLTNGVRFLGCGVGNISVLGKYQLRKKLKTTKLSLLIYHK